MVSDDEILMLIAEGDESAKEVLFEKYKHVIDILMAKYNTVFYHFGIEIEEAKAEALFGFSDSIKSYNTMKSASFETFLTLCVKRKLIKLIRKYNTNKSRFNNELYSLDYVYSSSVMPLVENIKDDDSRDPLLKLSDEETVNGLTDEIRGKLSEFEYEVYLYMLEGFNYSEIAQYMEVAPKKIDNAIQRIRVKIKNILENNEE